MIKPAFPVWLIGLVAIVALPTIGCACYYISLDIGDRSAVAVPIVLAYPALLISAIGLGGQLLSSRRMKVRTLVWAGLLTLASALLIIARR